METRARYALIGLFMLVVIAASFAFVYWLETKGGFGQRESYNVRFEGPTHPTVLLSAMTGAGASTGSFNHPRVVTVVGVSASTEAPPRARRASRHRPTSAAGTPTTTMVNTLAHTVAAVDHGALPASTPGRKLTGLAPASNPAKVAARNAITHAR